MVVIGAGYLEMLPSRRSWRAFDRFPFPLHTLRDLVREDIDSVIRALFKFHAATISLALGHRLSQPSPIAVIFVNVAVDAGYLYAARWASLQRRQL